jgi:hypothetical protein
MCQGQGRIKGGEKPSHILEGYIFETFEEILAIIRNLH